MHDEDQLQDAQEASHEPGSEETRVSGEPVWEGVLHQPRQAKSHVHETKR
jgi:hypothetical protein